MSEQRPVACPMCGAMPERWEEETCFQGYTCKHDPRCGVFSYAIEDDAVEQWNDLMWRIALQ